jgi:hypothetical protein
LLVSRKSGIFCNKAAAAPAQKSKPLKCRIEKCGVTDDVLIGRGTVIPPNNVRRYVNEIFNYLFVLVDSKSCDCR